jgi:hypothetical protein
MNVAVATIGHNRSPFELSKETIEDLYDEAKNWLDGEPIASQEQADEIQKLLRMIQAAEKEADERRKEEARPHDEAKAAIQERYNPLIGKTKTVIGKTILAAEACKKALAPWLMKIEEENRRKAEEARREAEEKQRLAMEAMRQRDGIDLEASARAEALVREAKEAEAAARAAGNAKASAKGEGRAVTLRDKYTPEITDYTAFARHVWTAHRSDMESFLNVQVAKIVASGVHNGIPGVTVHHERVPV